MATQLDRREERFWLRCAKAFEDGTSTRGICSMISGAGKLEDRLRDRLSDVMQPEDSFGRYRVGFWWEGDDVGRDVFLGSAALDDYELTNKCRLERVFACGLLAAMAASGEPIGG